MKLSFSMDWQGESLEVRCNYCPAEKATWSEWDGGCPGCGPEIEDVQIEGMTEDQVDDLLDDEGFLNEMYDQGNSAICEAARDYEAEKADYLYERSRERNGA